MKYKEIEVVKGLTLCVNNMQKEKGLYFITENGSYGFKLFKWGFSIKHGLVESCYYFN